MNLCNEEKLVKVIYFFKFIIPTIRVKFNAIFQ